MNTIRCTICNSVNNPAAQTDIGDYLGGFTPNGKHFHPDPKSDLNFICEECYFWYREVMTDFAIEDTLRDEEKSFYETLDDDTDIFTSLESLEAVEHLE